MVRFGRFNVGLDLRMSSARIDLCDTTVDAGGASASVLFGRFAAHITRLAGTSL